jgi:predicted membrane metal-binding protein
LPTRRAQPEWCDRAPSLTGRGWPKPLADALSAAVAAQLVTAPLVAGISGRFSVVSVVANLAVAAVIPPITVVGTAAAALCPLWPAGAQLLIRFTGHATDGPVERGRSRCFRWRAVGPARVDGVWAVGWP